MYYYLKGFIVELGENYVVIDVNSIGYQVLMMHPEDYSIGDEVLIYIAHIVREDEEYFIGFKSLKEKSLFNKLINCKGIGPKTALSALRGISVDEFIECIQKEDVKRLKKLEGIGPKAASQIILDLKGSLVDYDVKETKKHINQNMEDALQALKSLGFKEKDIMEYFKSIDDDTLTTQEYITRALRNIRK